MEIAKKIFQRNNWVKRLFFLSFSLTSFCTSAQLKFTDVSALAGIDHQYGVYEGTFGGGACVLDFNNDGWEDVYLAGGTQKDQLLRNNKDGTFTDVYHMSGLTLTANFVTQGAASADVNRDGFSDLIITTITSKREKKEVPRAPNLFFLNNGNGTFKNATREYGFADLLSFSQGACFGDINADGYPDLFIGNYFKEYKGQLNLVNDAMIVSSNQLAKGYLLINNEGKSFTDLSEAYNITYKAFGFGGALTDFDNDRDLDIIVNNDFGYKSTPNLLLQNSFPEEQFVNVAKERNMDRRINAMGVAVGDYNNDGLLDYYITNIRANHLMTNEGTNKPFKDKAMELGAAFNLIKDANGQFISTSWGANFADFDHDTDLDLFVANGCLHPNIEPVPDFLFENTGERFAEKGEELGVNDYGIARGSVVFDYDNDGDQDFLTVNQKPLSDTFYLSKSVTKLFRNENTTGNWIKIALRGTTTDKNGVGARIEVVVDTIKMIREIDGGSSYLSQNSVIAHFGLGGAQTIDSIVVKWIGDDQPQVLINQAANQKVEIIQNEKAFEKNYYGFVASIVVLISLAGYYVVRALRLRASRQAAS